MRVLCVLCAVRWYTRSAAYCTLNLADFCNINYNPISRHSICVVSMPIYALSLSLSSHLCVLIGCARSSLCGMRMNTTLILLCLHCKQILCDYFRLFHCLLHRIDLFLLHSVAAPRFPIENRNVVYFSLLPLVLLCGLLACSRLCLRSNKKRKQVQFIDAKYMPWTLHLNSEETLHSVLSSYRSHSPSSHSTTKYLIRFSSGREWQNDTRTQHTHAHTQSSGALRAINIQPRGSSLSDDNEDDGE